MTMLSDGMLLGASSEGEARPLFIESTMGSNSGSPSMSISKPAGASVGDLMLAVIWSTAASNATSSGWTLEGSNFTGSFRYAILSRVVDGSEGGSFTFSLSSSGTHNGAILLYRGGIGDVDVVGSRGFSSTVTSSAPSLTATESGTLLAVFGINSASRTVSSPPSGMTQRSFSNDTAHSTASYEQDASSPAGATSSKTLVWSGADTSSIGVQIQIY